ncbi:ABC transporter permease [Eggerthellaceae bacterium zg-893]|nr:ABC transporter permease [Eggerthellaceae bacterium zg-893]
MFDTYRYMLRALARDPGILVWALVFPVVLSTCFLFMFSGFEDATGLDPIPVIAVADEAYDQDEAFQQFIEALSDGGEAEDNNTESSTKAEATDAEGDATLAVTFAPDAEAAREELLDRAGDDDAPVAYVTLDDGVPQVFAVDSTDASGAAGIDAAIVYALMDVYASRAALAADIAQAAPALFADPAAVGALYELPDVTEKVSLTASAPQESVRYYFALLGMAALMGAQAALLAVISLLPNKSPLGARRSVSGVSRARALAGTLLACWTLSTACLCVGFAYMHWVCSVDVGDRLGWCLLVLAASSLMATALGALIAVLPRIPNGAKGGILTAITCFAALFAGLYGEPTMELADSVAAAFPASTLINPAVQVSEGFYSLLYYDSVMPCLGHVGVLLAMAVIFFLLSASALRRVRYASL